MRLPRSLLLLAAFPALASPLPPLTLEGACAGAGLIVVGTLSQGRQGKATRGFVWVEAQIDLQDVLYGTPAGKVSCGSVPVLWERMFPPGPLPPGARWTASPFEGQEGQRRIWCLHPCRAAGSFSWYVAHPGEVIPLEQLAEVEKAIQLRLAPCREVFEEGPELDKPSEKVVKALAQLEAAGPAAVPVVEALLGHPRHVQRAWGCWLAGRLVPGRFPLCRMSQAGPQPSPLVSALLKLSKEGETRGEALEALRKISGKPLKTSGEAETWWENLKIEE